MTNPPNCPAGHGPMVHVIITQGDSKDWHDDRVLGCAWFCPLDGKNGRAYCDECADCGCTPLEPEAGRQLSFIDDQGE